MGLVGHYRATGSTTDTYFTRSFNLFSNNKLYTNVAADRTGTPISGISTTNRWLPSTATGGNLYVQNLTTLWAQLKFPTVATFLRQNPELTLLKAELELIPEELPTPALRYYGPLPRLLVWQGNADHMAMGRNGFFTKAIPNGSSTNFSAASSFTHNYNDSTSKLNPKYSIDLTSYILAIEDGSVYNSGLWITAPLSVPFLAPFVFNIAPSALRRSRLKLYFVRL
jgi:hypothetical protein